MAHYIFSFLYQISWIFINQVPCILGQGHFVTSHLGDNMASVTWATKVSTKWVDQIDQLTDIFKEVSIFVVRLRSLRQVAILRHGHLARRFAPAFRALGVCEHIWLRYKNFDPSCFDPIQKFGMSTWGLTLIFDSVPSTYFRPPSLVTSHLA